MPEAERIASPPSCCPPGAPPPAEPLAEEVRAFKALGHPVRLGIVRALAQAEAPVCVCEVEAQFDLSQPTISHHLRLLREAGLVEATPRGTWVHYRLVPGALARLARFLAAPAG